MTARLVTLLAIAACLQLGAVVWLSWPEAERDTAAATGTSLLPFPREAIGHIRIADAGDAQVAITRRQGQWLIDGEALPAATAAVEQLLQALALPGGFPVARSDSARGRFEVAEERFQRRITLARSSDSIPPGDAERAGQATVYLGTSPGMRRVHARRGDSSAIQAITLSTFDVPATVSGWLDPAVLSLSGIERVRVGDREWARSGDTWSRPRAGETGEPPAAEALAALEQVLGTLEVAGVARPDDVAPNAEAGARELTVWRDNESTTLRLVDGAANEAHIYSSGFDRWFTLGRYDYDRLAASIDALLPAQTE